MKIFTHIFTTILMLLAIYQLPVAKDRDNQTNPLLILSPQSQTKMQIARQWLEHVKLGPVASFSFMDVTSSTGPSASYKSRKTAFFRSLILPGAGEYYLGKKTLARTFFLTEISLWLGYFAFRKYGQWVRDDALAFAATHSGASIAGKPSQFYVDIGNYLNVDRYNDAKQRMYQFDKVYTDPAYFWSWDSDAHRQKFDQLRVAGDRALNRSVFVLGGIFANHLISAIHSVWQTHRYNKKIATTAHTSVHFLVYPNYGTGEISFHIQKEF